MCAQPCRKLYILLVTGDIIAAQGTYPLSPHDFCFYPFLIEVYAAPVATLKIKGRMKTPDYVAIVTDAYRQTLDAIARGDAELTNSSSVFSTEVNGMVFVVREGNVDATITFVELFAADAVLIVPQVI